MVMVNYDFRCKVCDKQCFKRLSETRPPPKYCSNACRFHGQEKPDKISKFVCPFCGMNFERYAPPSALKGKTELYCSIACGSRASKQRNGKKLQSMHSYECLLCKEKFERYHSDTRKAYEFCSKACATKHSARGGTARTYEGMYQRWLDRYGKEEADRRLEDGKRRRSKATTERNTGSVKSPGTRRKISQSVTQAYVDGRLSPPQPEFGTKFVHGHYKGMYFRSSYELAFQLMMESKGYTLSKDVIYEPTNMRIKYESKGSKHTYYPDFYVVPEDMIYEIKPLNVIERSENVRIKLAAAKVALGDRFCVVTEKELGGFIALAEQVARSL